MDAGALVGQSSSDLAQSQSLRHRHGDSGCSHRSLHLLGLAAAQPSRAVVRMKWVQLETTDPAGSLWYTTVPS